MDASAIVKSSDHRPTLGKVSMGPLGADHGEVLGEILHKQRRSNPLKIVHDAVSDCAVGFFNCCDYMNPTKVSPEYAAGTAKVMKAQTRSAVSCLFLLVVMGLLLLYQIIEIANVTSDWTAGSKGNWENVGGDARCTVLDIIQSSSVNEDVKMLIRIDDNETRKDNGGVSIIDSEKQSRYADGWEGHHPSNNANTNADDTPDNPFSCHIEKTRVELGPCCQSDYGPYEYEIGDTFDCVFTFEQKYCNKIDFVFMDDDFRGFGEGPYTPEDTTPGIGPTPVPIPEHINQICCEPEIPIHIPSLMVWFVLCCTMTASMMWCLLFRAKYGVWHRMCPFQDAPAEAHVYDGH
ncbi:hypothetical protein TrLO_g15258 [Triparma laevis f. longispina]|uniref:Uncharacterized protein n=1 Tax=Triparma laevis f. longispina TaxID=1714387 RepID=A0A9W6ZT89_9STRA|nr:hypothetical protein TrLO_g15258 [Triparma laevis f. longispina]